MGEDFPGLLGDFLWQVPKGLADHCARSEGLFDRLAIVHCKFRETFILVFSTEIYEVLKREIMDLKNSKDTKLY